MRAVQRRPAVSAEHEFEAQHGLPEPLPAGERLIWQGQPAVGQVARRIFHMPLVAAYFGLLVAWAAVAWWSEAASLGAWLRQLAWPAGLAACALGLLAWLAQLTARTTVYTLTDKRVVLRIGIVLTVSYNLPLRCIDAAHVADLDKGHADVALQLRAGTRLPYLQLWPHARPWRVSAPQPMLRCLPQGRAVAAQLVQAWQLANAQTAQPVSVAQPAPSSPALPSLGSGAAA